MTKPSLKTQITIFLPITTCVVLALALLLAHTYFQRSIKASVSTQQYLTVSVLADDIDQKLLSASEMITGLARKISLAMVSDPSLMQDFFKNHKEYTTIFDNNLIILDISGKILAESTLGSKRRGVDLSSRDYFKNTKLQARPYISEPYISTQHSQHPALMFTAPILNQQGKMIALLGGSIDLTKQNVVARIREIKIGRTGYLFLFSEERKMILHPDSSRIMKNDLALGANKLLDLAIAGFDGTDETTNTRDRKMLTSFRHLKTKNWILAANLPLAEAYESVHRLNLIFAGTAIPVLLMIFFSMRRFLKRVTDPLLDFTRHVEQLPDQRGSRRLYHQHSGLEEVDTLSKSFNTLISNLDKQQDELVKDLSLREQAESAIHRQNEYLLALHKTTLGLISRLDINNLLKDIITRAASLMNTEHGYIYLLDPGTNKMVIQVHHGVFDTFEHHSLERGQGMAGHVWASGAPCHVENYGDWPGRLQDPMRDLLHAMAGIPLTSDGKVIGVIGLAYIDNKNRFDDEKMGLLGRFAELASLALDNARLYDTAQRELAERAKAEESLRKLSHVVEQSPISIVITDLQGNIEYANPYSTQITGYELHEVKGKNPRLMKSGFTSQGEYETLWKTITSGHEWRGEFYNRKKNGDYYWELALISPLRNQSGDITHYIAIKEDISDRKKLETQLRHSQKMEAIGQLAGGIAHDFNNILTAIIGYATIMQIKIEPENPVKATVDQILSAAERGASLTQGLLAFSRKQVTNPSQVDLKEIVARVGNLLLRLIGEDIHLKTTLSKQELIVMADSIQIEQVLMNLSTNARDAMPSGGTISITTGLVTIDSYFIASQGFGEPGDYALLTFSDTGSGMSEDTVKRIFEPFFTTKETGKGTGLGLSIVYGIIKNHNGFITCHSVNDEGTNFRIYLPLTPDALAPQVEEAENVPYPGGHEVILLAEDDETMRLLTKELLEEFGYMVIATADGLQALEIYQEQHLAISLVILDAIMPGMKGMEVYHEIKKTNCNAKVLFCSGYNPGIIEKAQRPDLNLHFISKPFMPKELLMKIRGMLEDAA
ncbi:MAG TPA: ATP-binding protein [Desulfuromonadaceae bacterium]